MPRQSRFNIKVHILGELTEIQQRVFRNAGEFWSSVIAADVPGVRIRQSIRYATLAPRVACARSFGTIVCHANPLNTGRPQRGRLFSGPFRDTHVMRQTHRGDSHGKGGVFHLRHSP